MKVLILGGCGMLGPWVVKALKHRHDIILTDIDSPGDEFDGDFRQVSSDDLDGVVATAEGCDAIINLSVLREDRKLAFDVSTRGNYNMMEAARVHGIERVINTGPHFQLVGETYENWDFDLNPDMPPQFGTRLYAHSKGLGQEICRVFSEQLRHLCHHDALLQHAPHLELGHGSRCSGSCLSRGHDAIHHRVDGLWYCDPGRIGSPARTSALPLRDVFRLPADSAPQIQQRKDAPHFRLGTALHVGDAVEQGVDDTTRSSSRCLVTSARIDSTQFE